jgi:hypothetical protein
MEVTKYFVRTTIVTYGKIKANCRCFNSLTRAAVQPLSRSSNSYNDKYRSELIQRTFSSHTVSTVHDGGNYSSSTDYSKRDNGASLDSRAHAGYKKSQNPSNRLDSRRSDHEWEQIHCTIMKKDALQVSDIDEAEKCVLWWIARCRAGVQKTKQERMRNNRFKRRTRQSNQNMVNICKKHSNGAAKAIASALDLFGRVVEENAARPELLQMATTNNMSMIDENWKNSYDRLVPRATHVLNAILDAWRLCWIDIGNDNKYLPTPETIFALLKDKWSDLMPMNERTYFVVMDAPVAVMNLLCDETPQYQVPIFCEKVIDYMLHRKGRNDVHGHPHQFFSEISMLPENASYATALNAWARSGRSDAASRAESLFNQFLTLCSNGTIGAIPNIVCYNSALMAMTSPPKAIIKQRTNLLKKSRDIEQQHDLELVNFILSRHQILNRADDVFRAMQRCPHPKLMPDSVSFRTMIFAWADYAVDLRYVDRNKSSEAMDRAVALLYEVAKLQVDSGSNAIDINYSFFGKLITSLALNQPQTPDVYTKADRRRAEEIYHHMSNLYRRTRDERFTPDSDILCAMILVYANDGRPFEADAILFRLEHEARVNNEVASLPRISYYSGMYT